MGDSEELERLWRGRLADAKLRHQFAVNFLKDARHAYGNSPECDNAIQAESAANQHYVHVLQLFNALVLEGKVPDEDEWRRGAGH